VSDIKGGVYNKAGLDIAKLSEHSLQTGSVVGFKYADNITGDELWEVPCDILVPAAMENQIVKSNCNKIKTRLVIEGANGPTSSEADEVLNERGILIVPDILANTGGVIVSYFEWIQDSQAYFWSEDQVNAELKTRMVKSFNEVFSFSQEKKVDLRIAAQMLALNRIAQAMAIRGIFP
jgi:glutamate dehydrogenase (NAD(P)+)